MSEPFNSPAVLREWLEKEYPDCCSTWKTGGPSYCAYCMCAPEAHAIKRLLESHELLLTSVRELYDTVLSGMQKDYDEMTTQLGRARAAMKSAWR